MKVKKILSMALAVGISLSSAVYGCAEASNLDTYRNLLKQKTYTIKYIDITPQSRTTNSDKVPMYGKSSMDTSKSAFLAYKPTENVVVADGANRYEEIGAGLYKQCRLTKGEDIYYFVKYDNNGTMEVYGDKKGVVSAVPINNLAIAMQGYGYGGDAMTRYLNVILPAEDKTVDMPHFKYVGMGWLPNGMNYEDWSYQNDGIFEAVRYYFDQYALVKIAAATYWTNGQGIMEGTKTILKITEFSPTPNQSYLNLPEGVKDKTKRKKKED